MANSKKKISIITIAFASLAGLLLFQNFILPSSAKNEFYLDPSQLSNLLIQNNPERAAWAPTEAAPGFFSPGIKLIMWGKGQGCDDTFANGPMRSAKYLVPTDVTTGLQPGHAGNRKIWTPEYPLECNPNSNEYSKNGDSFIHVNADATTGGVGLYTHNGPLSDGSKSFFIGFDSTGQGETGSNAFIEGNFFSIRNPKFRDSSNIFPFASVNDEMRVQIRQSVPQFKVPAGESMQTKQQVNFTLMNHTCREEKRGLCQVQYLINMAIYRKDPAYFKTEFPNRVWSDPAQGNMVIVEGSLGRQGQFSTIENMNGETKQLWRSLGARTQHAPFLAKDFDVRISFQNFKNALLIAAEQNSDPNIIHFLGSKWDDPNEWFLLQTEVAQEVSNQSYSTQTAYIGGNFTHLQIGSSTLPSRKPAKIEQPYVNQINFSNAAVEKTYSYSETGKTENGGSGNTVLILNREAAYAKANINATENGNITLLFSRGPNRGIAYIYVDDVYHTQIDLRSDIYKLHPLNLYTSKGNHEIKVVRSEVTSGTNYFIALHNIKAVNGAYSSFVPLDSASVAFSGTHWLETAGYAVLGQNQASASVQLDNATGKIVLQSMDGPNRGIADIYINDVYWKSVNLYASSYKLVDHAFLFPIGKYKITIKRSGFKSSSASDYYVVLNNVSSK